MRIVAIADLLLPVSNLTVPHSDYNSLIRTHKNSGNNVGIMKLRTSCMWLNQEWVWSTRFHFPVDMSYYCQVKNRAQISHSWTHTKREDFPLVILLSNWQLYIEYFASLCIFCKCSWWFFNMSYLFLLLLFFALIVWISELFLKVALCSISKRLC